MVALADIWEYRSDLERLARYLCRHPQDAEDVTHNALMKAAQKLDGFRGQASVRTWLHTITTNECRMLRRRKSPASLDEMFDGVAVGDLSAERSLDPEEVAIELETRREVLEALARIPDRYRCALLLKDGRGMPLDEVARLMGTTVPSVKSVLHRARKALRAELQSA